MDLDRIRLPAGFSIEVYAEVPNARSLAMGDNGVVFVSNRSGRSIFAIVPVPGQAKPQVVELADRLDTPNGIAYHDGDLYVAEIDRVLRYPDIGRRIYNVPEPEVLPIDGRNRCHWKTPATVARRAQLMRATATAPLG